MRDVHEGGAELAVQPLQLGAHLGAQVRVEVRKRLVEEVELRLADQRTAECDALALPAGEIARLAPEQGRETQHLRRLRDPLVDLGARQPRDLEREGEVFAHVLVRVERVALENHGEVALRGGKAVDLPPADADGAAGRLVESGDEIERGGLAAPRGSDEREELAVGDLERQVA